MEDPKPGIDVLRQVLEPADLRLRLALDLARARIGHAASKGALLESELRQIIADHLPRAFAVGQGEVVDSLGNRTGQVDLVITNEYQPFRWAADEPGVHIIEGVCAGGELKSLLGHTELADVIAKGSRFKRLRYRAHSGAQVYGRHEADLDRFYESPPFIGVAVESSVSVQTMLDRLASAPTVPSSDGVGGSQDPVDAIFLLDRGVALNLGDGNGQLKFLEPNGNLVAGWVFYETNTVLAEMLVWLYRVMPRFSMMSGSPINNYGAGSSSVSFYRPNSAKA
jgi:hypothetical protein